MVLPLQGAILLAVLNPGRCPGLGDDWPYRPFNTTSETFDPLINYMNNYMTNYMVIICL